MRERTSQLSLTNETLRREIAERERMEESPRESEKNLSLIYDTVSDLLFQVKVESDGGFRFLSVNRAFLDATGLAEKKVVGKRIEDVIPEPSRALVRGRYEAAIREKTTITWEETSVYPSGVKIGLVAVTPALDEDGICTHLIGLVHDITERKRAEEAVRASEAKYRSLFENMLEGCAYCRIILDDNDQPVDFVYLDVNDFFEKLTGLEKDKAIGARVTELIPGITESRPNLFEIYGKVALTGESTRFDLYFQPLQIWLSISVYCPQREYFVAVFDNITERKLAEEALRASEERFRTSVENMLDCFGVYSAVRDPSGHIVDFQIEYVNEAACVSNQMTREQQIGKHLCQLLPAHRETGLFDEYRQVVETGKPLTRESLIYEDAYGKQRLSRAFDIRAVKLGDGFAAAWRDVTERKRAEEALRESEARLLRSQHVARMGFLTWDLTTNDVYWSDEVFRLYGIDPQKVEATLDLTMQLVHLDDLDLVRKNLEMAVQGVSEYDIDHRILRPNGGTVLWVHAQAELLRDAEGTAVTLLGTVVDITERKRAEDRAARLGRILDDSLNEIYIFDAQTYRFVQVNRGARRNLGYSMAELRRLTPLDLKPEFTPESFAKLVEPLRTGEKRIVGFATVHRRKDGAVYPVWVHLQLMIHESSPVFVAIILDVTESKRAEDKLRGMEAQLAHVARVSTVGEMVAGIAHEVNQPLCSIRNFTQATGNLLAADKQVNLDDLREWNAAISRAASHAVEVVKRLRGFVRRTELQRSFCRINEIVNETLHLVAFEAGRHETAVRLELSEVSPVVHVDRVEIQQVLVNLLQNAYEAMKESDATLREVTVGTEPSAEFVEISVADVGPGLPSENDLQIFSAFVTTKPDGLGMGLAIATTIVEAHDGRLWAASNRDGGATFHFTLPVAREGVR